jgi:predicted amidohydrolase YtcJ
MAAATDSVADVLVTNARVLTMDPRAPVAEAVLIRGERIAGVGNDSDLRAATASPTVLDVAGATVVPGFIDAHTHFELASITLEHMVQAYAPPCRTLAEIASVVRRELDELGGSGWVVCRSSFGLQHKVAERRLFGRDELDALCPRRPLVIFAGLHVAMLNSAGLHELGLLGGRVPRGSTLQRDASGRPTGVVTEVANELPGWTAQQVADAVERRCEELLLRNGITSICSIPKWRSDFRGLREASASGRLPVRVAHYPVSPWVVEPRQFHDLAKSRVGTSTGKYRIGGIKLFVDGQGGDGISAHFDDLKYSQAELNEVVRGAHTAGLQVIMHTVTQTGIEMASRAIGRVVPDGSNPLRHRIEHGADYANADALFQIHRSGAVLVTTPHFMASESAKTAPPTLLRTLFDAGIPVAGGTDSTGTVPEGASPLFNVACAVLRRRVDGSVADAAQALSVAEALELFTWRAAWASHDEGNKGTLRPGLFGDLTVLSADPLATDPDRLEQIHVDATIVGGEVVYER